MTARSLTIAWITLVGLSLIAAAVSAGLSPRLAGPVILLLAVLKSRVILSDYLGLAAAPAIRRGFNLALSLFALVLLGLYMAG